MAQGLAEGVLEVKHKSKVIRIWQHAQRFFSISTADECKLLLNVTPCINNMGTLSAICFFANIIDLTWTSIRAGRSCV